MQERRVDSGRPRLPRALAQTREETAPIDVIASEDIGKFPDSHLAECMHRVPGVALSRGDGGEGKSISVRDKKANLFLDADAWWKLSDHLTLILEAQNLARERSTHSIDRTREDTLFQIEIGRTFNLGATFKF